MAKQFSRIEINPQKKAGKPCIKGTRLTVFDILDYLSSGMSKDEIIENYPPLKIEDIVQALDYAKNNSIYPSR